MRTVIVTLLLFSICSFSHAQTDQDTTILLKAFREFYKRQPIVYVDSFANDGSPFEELKINLRKRRVRDIYKTGRSNSIKLTRQEKKYLLAQSTEIALWDENLFYNSKRIDADSVKSYWDEQTRNYTEQFNQALQKKDTESLKKLKYVYPYVFSFTKPVYIRNNTVCLISFMALCGYNCGRNETSFYRKEDNGWQKWILIVSGDF